MHTLISRWRRPSWPGLLLAVALLGACTIHEEVTGAVTAPVGYDSFAPTGDAPGADPQGRDAAGSDAAGSDAAGGDAAGSDAGSLTAGEDARPEDAAEDAPGPEADSAQEPADAHPTADVAPADVWAPPQIDAAASQDVPETSAAPGEDQIDLAAVVVIKGAPGIAQWPVTAQLTDVAVAEDELCTWHTKAGQWPTVPFFDDPENPIEGNQWLFANIGGTWYGGAGEWLRPAQECKVVKSANIGPDEFYNDDEEPLHSWVPAPGELVGVMVSTPARAWPAMATLDERSNVVLVPWSW